jgi:predicted Zn-dependent protease
MVTSVGEQAGMLTSQQAASINRSAAAVEKTFQDITPEQEYYIGRSVAATVFERYRTCDRPAVTAYLNVLGQALAQASDRPETFGGYHFAVLDTEEINAFAAPGGLIVVSRGLIRCCGSEDALAAVLAHEVAHAALQHGLRAIRKGRLTSALTTLAVEAGKNLAGENLAQVTQAFEGSITDITATLLNSGYARAFETQADRAAVEILRRVGYNPEALIEVLGRMKVNLKPGGIDFAKTHPDPLDRSADVRKLLGPATTVVAPPARQARFAAAVRGV